MWIIKVLIKAVQIACMIAILTILIKLTIFGEAYFYNDGFPEEIFEILAKNQRNS